QHEQAHDARRRSGHSSIVVVERQFRLIWTGGSSTDSGPTRTPHIGGGRGIRTPGPCGPRLFKSLAFVRSAIPPNGSRVVRAVAPGILTLMDQPAVIWVRKDV